MPKHSASNSGSGKKWLTAIVVLLIVIIAGVGISHSFNHNKSTTQQTVTKVKPKPVKLSKAEKKTQKTYNLTPLEAKTAHETKITAIGDSVMLDIEPTIKDIFPKSYVDGQVGRQFNQLPGLVTQIKAEGHLANDIVINLGTNGPPEKSDIDNFLKEVGNSRQVYWVTTHVPTQPWQKTTNNLIMKTAQQHSNVHVVDWQALSKNHSSWFAPDHIHVQTQGAKQYVRLIVQVLSKVKNQ